MFWKRKPVTHAVALWILVGLAAAGLIGVAGYFSVLANLRQGVPQAKPSPGAEAGARQEQPPSLFGTIVSVDGRLLKVDSKQGFTEVLFDEDTSITSVGGQERPASDLVAGAVITATGKDLGGGKMDAAAIVILDAR